MSSTTRAAKRLFVAYLAVALLITIAGPGLAVYGAEGEPADAPSTEVVVPVEEVPAEPVAEPLPAEPTVEPPLAEPLPVEPEPAPAPIAPAVETAVVEDVPPEAGPAFPALAQGGVRIFSPASGTYTAANVSDCAAPVPDGFELTLQVFATAEGTFVSVHSSHPMAKVVVCGGEAGSNVYQLGGATDASWLHAPAAEGVFVVPCALDVYFCAQPVTTGCLDVYKFEDTDRDGRHDDGEAMLEGVQFALFNASGAQVGSGSTGSDGRLRFRGLYECTYTAVETLPSGWENTTPLRQSVLVCPGETPALCFGNVRAEEAPEPGTLAIYKFSDANRDGTRAANEVLLPGWQFIIYDENGVELRRVTTGADGSIVVELDAGTYAVQEVAQSGWTATTAVRRTVSIVSGEQASVWFGNAEEFLPFTPAPQPAVYDPGDPFLPFTGGEYLLLLGAALASGAGGLALRIRQRRAA